MKIAVTGKGGVGKTTLTAMLARLEARAGREVLCVDADPDANLARALGADAAVREALVPVSERRQLIEERTGAKVREFGQMFTMNPEVSDLVEACGQRVGEVHLVVMGGAHRAGKGCACPENVLLRSLMSEIVLARDEPVFLDMEAGIEHLGRGTTRGVDGLVVVVEPSRSSLDSATRIRDMAGELGLERVGVVGNRVDTPGDEDFVRQEVGEAGLLGFLPTHPVIRRAEREGRDLLLAMPEGLRRGFERVHGALRDRFASGETASDPGRVGQTGPAGRQGEER